ncbi:hypothetical protein H4R34_005267, partial [Dimargaris verticillata]
MGSSEFFSPLTRSRPNLLAQSHRPGGSSFMASSGMTLDGRSGLADWDRPTSAPPNRLHHELPNTNGLAGRLDGRNPSALDAAPPTGHLLDAGWPGWGTAQSTVRTLSDPALADLLGNAGQHSPALPSHRAQSDPHYTTAVREPSNAVGQWGMGASSMLASDDTKVLADRQIANLFATQAPDAQNRARPLPDLLQDGYPQPASPSLLANSRCRSA